MKPKHKVEYDEERKCYIAREIKPKEGRNMADLALKHATDFKEMFDSMLNLFQPKEVIKCECCDRIQCPTCNQTLKPIEEVG